MTAKTTSFQLIAHEITETLREAGLDVDYAPHNEPEDGRTVDIIVYDIKSLTKLNKIIQKGTE